MGVPCFLDTGLRRNAHVRQEILVQAAEDERKRKPAETGKKLPTVSLTLVSFAVTRKAYERITARFAQQYEAKTGQAVRFRLSFGGSGTQVRFRLESVISTNISRSCGLSAEHCRRITR